MRYAIWGSRQRAHRVAACLRKVDFFIDHDVAREDLEREVPVVHPDKIYDWDDLFVYVPENIYADVAPVLIAKGLKENIDFINCPLKSVKISFKWLMECLAQYEKHLQASDESSKRDVVIFSSLLVQENPYMNFVAQMIKHGLAIGLFPEMYVVNGQSLNEEYMAHFHLFEMTPAIDSNVVAIDVHLNQEQVDCVVGDPALYDAMLQHRAWCSSEVSGDVHADSSCCMVYAMKRFAEAFIRLVRPERVVLHGSSIPSHKVLARVCAMHGVPVCYTHEGVIPGTYVIEAEGEMGHSLPAMYPKCFMALPVSEDEMSQAQRVWEYLYESKLNRKIQPQTDCQEYIQSQLWQGRPTIFFAGQNDIGSHMVPYTKTTKKYHSPIFHSSLEAAIYLAHICEKNGWNFVYKPHPDYMQPEQAAKLPRNAIFLARGDINVLIDLADVTVTILSTTNYNALIRRKPVVMLGYNQTKGKGCTYEAFEKDKIEDAIKAALENGFTQEQQDAFLLHMAQCLKYYLYDDLQDRPIRYGRPVPKSLDEFYELERLLKGNVAAK